MSQVAIGRREQISVYGDDYKTRDGTGDRDYVHVMDLAEGHVKVRHHQHHAANDHCQAVDHILGAGKEGVHIFNLGTGTGATVLEVNSSIIFMVFDQELFVRFFLSHTECHLSSVRIPHHMFNITAPEENPKLCTGQVIAAFSEASGKKIPHVIAPR